MIKTRYVTNTSPQPTFWVFRYIKYLCTKFILVIVQKIYKNTNTQKKLLYKAYLGHSAGIFEVPGLAVVTDRTHGRVAHDTLADLP